MPNKKNSTSNTLASNRSLRYPRHWWLEHYQAWKTSGQTKAEYCATHDITPSSFYNWACRFQNQTEEHNVVAGSSPFIQIVTQDPSLPPANSLTVNGVTLRFDAGLTPQSVIEWIKTLRRTSC